MSDGQQHNFGANPFEILNLLGRYHDLVKMETENLPELNQMYGEIQAWAAKHQKLWAVLPEVTQAITEMQAILHNHDKLIKTEQAYIPHIQGFTKELLAIVAPQQQ